MYSWWSQRMSGITLKRSASALRIVSLPASVRPTGSGPRASQKVASSVKNEAMQSTSRLLKAAEIAFINSGVAMSLLVVVTSGMLASLVSCSTIAGYAERSNDESPPCRTTGRVPVSHDEAKSRYEATAVRRFLACPRSPGPRHCRASRDHAIGHPHLAPGLG